MKEPFNRFAVRYLVTVLLGLAALLLHGSIGGLPGHIFLPENGAPWEVSKLAYWPMLAALAVVSVIDREVKVEQMLPGLVLTAPVLFGVCWLFSGWEPGWECYLALWMALTALGTALPLEARRDGHIWLLLAALLGALYVLFALLPPAWTPFLDPHSALAMARSPIPC